MASGEVTALKDKDGGSLADLLLLLSIYWPLLLGNILEWYEFGVYGYLVPQMEANFFHGSEIATWLGFASTFLSRPLGGLVLGWIGDNFGRKTSVNLSIVGMLIGTVGQGLLPTGTVISVPLLVSLRVIQGISAGGEIAAAITYIAEVAPSRSFGRSIALVGMSAVMGGLAAIGVVALLVKVLGNDKMMSWGWRIPFIVSIVPGLIALYGRRRMPESDAFEEERRTRIAPDKQSAEESMQEAGIETAKDAIKGYASIMHFLRHSGWAVLLGIGGTVASFGTVYMGVIWGSTHLQTQGLPAQEALLAALLFNLVMFVFQALVGWAADVWGVAFVTFVGGTAVAVSGAPLFAILSAYPMDFKAALLCFAGYGILGGLNSVCFAFIVELFPTSVRNLGVGIAYNGGAAIFGGLGPLAATASLSLTQLGPGFLVSSCGAITAGTVLLGLHLQKKGKTNMTNVRPYRILSGCKGQQPDGLSSQLMGPG